MNAFKKFAALLLALMMILSLAACGRVKNNKGALRGAFVMYSIH